MTTLFGDLETFSTIDIKCGTHAYAEQAEILLFPYALDDGAPQCWDVTSGDKIPKDLYYALGNPGITLVGHNWGMFDTTVIHHAMPEFEVPHNRVFDTMACAYAHSLPGALDTLCTVLGVPTDKAKHKTGKQLIQLFCKPRPKNSKLRRATRETHPEEWQRFIDYAKGDIEATRAVYHKLPKWNYQGEEYALWLLDQRINSRGVAVDTALARSAVRAAEKAREHLANRSEVLTEGAVASTTQRDALLAHVLEAYGVHLPDMQMDTLERRMADPDLPEQLKELLSVRLQATSTSVRKYATLMKAVSEDGRLRGLLQWNGAGRTGRWSGRVFQPQNLPRPSMKQADIDFATEVVKADACELFYNNVMSVLTNCIRGAIIAPEGRKLVVADLSNIEGRVAAWLAGEEWKVKYFHDFDAGRIEFDNYIMAYAKSFGVDPSVAAENKKTSDGSMRQIGKVQELMLQYQGRVGAFVTGAATYGINLEELAVVVQRTASAEDWATSAGFLKWCIEKKMPTYGLSDSAFIACDVLAMAWRAAHPMISSYWKELQGAFAQAVNNPGTTVHVRKLSFRREGGWLKVKLPSGRFLCYPSPKVSEEGTCSYMGVDQYTRKWQRQQTYGGKLFENCIAQGTPVLTRRGWVPIQRVRSTDDIWDGVEWVGHQGLVYKGKQFVVSSYGVTMTPDHLVLTTEGWKSASSCEGYNRADCGLPDSSTLRRIGRGEVAMGGAVPLREDGNYASFGDEETESSRDRGLLRVHAQADNREAEHEARHVRAPSVRGLAKYGRQVQLALASGVEKLRGAWNSCVRKLADVRELLGRHGAYIPRWVLLGPPRQLCGVQPVELRMAHKQTPGEQQAQQCGFEHTKRADDAIRSGGVLPSGPFDVGVPTLPRMDAGASPHCVSRLHKSEVYDLMNCGPRSRFVVQNNDGDPIIVHNCTQAVARDVMAHAMPLAEEQGYEIVLTVHDELITETRDDASHNAEGLSLIMSSVPSWGEGLPLAAAGFETYRYRKD